MEHKKDTNNESNRNNGQNSQGQTKPQVYQGFSYIMRKAEKLTTALYLVTDILSEKEPLKWKAREIGVEVLSDVTISSTASASEKMSMLREVLKKIEKVVAFLDVAQSARMMTDMNASMLKKEYVALKDNIEAEWSRTHDRSKMLLSERFFDVQEESDAPEVKKIASEVKQPVAAEEKETVREIERTFTLTQKNEVKEPAREVPRREEVSQAPRPTPQSTQTFTPRVPAPNSAPSSPRIGHTELTTTPQSRELMQNHPETRMQVVPNNSVERAVVAQAPSFKPTVVVNDAISRARPDVARDDRRTIILALLKQKPAVTVGDIAKSIPGVSEKTIQRELLAMVSEGVLVKRGERRWSTYSIRES